MTNRTLVCLTCCCAFAAFAGEEPGATKGVVQTQMLGLAKKLAADADRPVWESLWDLPHRDIVRMAGEQAPHQRVELYRVPRSAFDQSKIGRCLHLVRFVPPGPGV